MESIVELLFKYPPIVFAKGRLAWLGGFWAWGVLGAGLVAVVLAARSYAQVRSNGSSRTRLLLLGLRIGAVVLLVLVLLRPALVVSTAVPQRNVIGVLLDDSESMQIADTDSGSRAAFAHRMFGPEGSALLDALQERFLVRLFRFSRHAGRIHSAADLTERGDGSYLGQALEEAARELTTAPLAGLVVVTDGADNADSSLTPTLLGLKTRGIPVSAVGIGARTFRRDIEITRVDGPHTVVAGSTVLVEVGVRQRGLAGRRVPVQVEGDGKLLATEDITLPADDRVTTSLIRIRPDAPGPLTLRVRIPVQPDEVVVRNNERVLLLSVLTRRDKILYFEGEPRFEFGFLRRAVAEDSALQVIGLLRSAEHKFLRLGVDDSLELLSGFPTRREDLFAYRALVLGSIEASFFTVDQLRMIADFVNTRGGGLLVLGGRHALGEGGFAGTPVEDLYPFGVAGGAAGGDTVAVPLRPAITPAGLSHPALQLAETADSTAARWNALPPVTAVNRIGPLKPGAAVLLDGRNGDGGAVAPILAWQRFGRGKVAALPIQDSWIWRMDAAIAPDDQTHETFWRRLLRWLAESSLSRVAVTLSADQVTPGEAFTIEAEVRDAAYLPVNDARPVAQVTMPSGAVAEVPLEWSAGRDGVYRGTVIASEPGRYTARVTVSDSAGEKSSDPALGLAGPMGREFFGAEMQESLLRRVAEETGGRYYTPATVQSLPGDLVYTEGGVTVQEEKELWDMPIVFVALLLLWGSEWTLRRRRGLA